jgi:hypothetical protein
MLLFTNWLHHATPGRWEDLASKARGWRTSRSLPKIRPLSEDPSTVWRAITASNWYGKEKRSVEVVSDTAVWHSTGLPAVPLRAPLRPPSRVQDPGAPLHRSSCRPGADHLLVRAALADGATFQEVRQRLGFATQRHWSERALRRTAPALLVLFSVVTLFAHPYMAKNMGSVRQTAWYCKTHPTFSDALALVRRELRAQPTSCRSPSATDTVKVRRAFLERLTDTVCYAA